ncbi:hypothetical protein HDU97_009598 [Phlyctochytrium planicorne]|nr:hypothetical protein HDU97_009598 [Phlyctochytrium planicorne]
MKSIVEETMEDAMDSSKMTTYEKFKAGLFETTKYKDITSMLVEATDRWSILTSKDSSLMLGLEIGEVVHLPTFTMWDSMSAIEIMDPKMDTGFDEVGKPPKKMPSRQEINQMSLSGTRLIGFMDKLMELEVFIVHMQALD